MRIVFLGPPGAGKGTQAVRVAESHSIPHISTGDILRGAIRLATPTGVEAKKFVDAGELVPDDIMFRLVEDRLQEEDAAPGWLLDGFPRNLQQAEAFQELTDRISAPLEAVVYFAIPDRVVVSRLAGRRLCKECQAPYHVEFAPPKKSGLCDHCGGVLFQRTDDHEEGIRTRLTVYAEETNPLVEHYRERGLLIEQNADLPPDEVAHELAEKLAGL